MSMIQHQTRQPDTTTNFQYPQATNRMADHMIRQHHARGPDNTEQGPGSGRNAELLGHAIRIIKLLIVTQGTDMNVHARQFNGVIAQS
jgi:hypothetical protein